MTVAAFQGWYERAIEELNRCGRQEGDAACAHFKSLYPIPEGPGADLLEVSASALETSSVVMSSKGRGGTGMGSSSWEGGMGVGTVGKKRAEKTRCMSDEWRAKDPSMSKMGGMRLARRPWRHAVALQSLLGEVRWSSLFDQARLASRTAFLSSFAASVWQPRGVERTSDRAASQWAFHHLTPRKSGVRRRLKRGSHVS